MVLLAYGGLSGSLLLSVVAALWLLGMPGNAIVPVAVQIAGVLLGAAMAVDFVLKSVPRGRAVSGRGAVSPIAPAKPGQPHLLHHKPTPAATTTSVPVPSPTSRPLLLKPIPRGPRMTRLGKIGDQYASAR